jgi:hypothetical protein
MQYSSETLGKLSDALAKAQAEMQNAPLNKVNPHFKSKYADLAAIRDTVTAPLAKHGLALMQTTGIDENGQFALFTRLSHSSGEWMLGVYPLPLDPGKPQQMGSAMTYARRYTLAAMVGIAADEDDDANAAQTNGQSQPAKTYSASAKRGNQQMAKQDASPSQEFVEQFMNEFIPACQTVEELRTLWERNWKHIKALSQEQRDRVEGKKEQRKTELQPTQQKETV